MLDRVRKSRKQEQVWGSSKVWWSGQHGGEEQEGSRDAQKVVEDWEPEEAVHREHSDRPQDTS